MLGTKVKAAILVEQKKPLIIDDITLPENLEAGQVLVKLYSSGICGSQIGEIDGVKGHDPWLPHLLGHEGVGVVIECGAGVQHVKKDDKVILHWRPSKGIQAQTAKYRWNNKIVNSGWVTTFNEMAVVSENRLTPFHSDKIYHNASLFGCAITTAFGVVTNDAKIYYW